MRDFLKFFRAIFKTLYFVRGILITFIVLFAGIAFVISRVESLPYGDSLYFVCISALTIGYGDITPQTPMGRILSVVSGLLGMLFTGIVIAVAVQSLIVAIKDKRDSGQ